MRNSLVKAEVIKIASIEAAPAVADLIARELGKDEAWKKKAVEEYTKVAQGYVLQDT